MFASCYQPVPQIPSCILRIRIFFYDEKKECLDAKEKVAQRIQQQQKRDFYEWTRKKKTAWRRMKNALFLYVDCQANSISMVKLTIGMN